LFSTPPAFGYDHWIAFADEKDEKKNIDTDGGGLKERT
jgi:hypothetical protein